MKQNTAQHTPGPWFRMDKRYDNMDRVCIEIATFSNDGIPKQRIATVNHCDINPVKETSETVAANARLIATAPELLEALRGLYSSLAWHIDNHGHFGMDQKRMDAARAAIAAANQP